MSVDATDQDDGVSEQAKVTAGDSEVKSAGVIEDAASVLERTGVYGPNCVSEKSKEVIIDQLGQVADFFNKWGNSWYLAGGLALELGAGEIMRDHANDFDVAIKSSDIRSLIEFAIRENKRIVKPLRTEEFDKFREQLGPNPKITFEDKESGTRFVETDNPEVLLSGGNFFLHSAETGSASRPPIDIDILDETPGREIIFHPDKDITFPSKLYESAPKYDLPNNKKISLTPAPVQVIHKLFGGRDKELIDVAGSWNRLSEYDRAYVNSSLGQAKLAFRRGEEKGIKRVEDLLAIIPKEELELASRNLMPQPDNEQPVRRSKHWEIVKT